MTAVATDPPGETFVVGPSPVLLLAPVLIVIVVVLLRRSGRSPAPEVPSSGRWVDRLRRIVDVGIALIVAAVVTTAIVAVVDPDGLGGVDGGRLSLGADGIAMRFETGNVRPVGEVVPAVTLRDRANGAGRGFDDDDARQGDMVERYGAGARLYGAEEVELDVARPGAAAWIAAGLTVLVRWGAVLVALVALRGVLAGAADGVPFHERSVRLLRVMAGAAAAAVVLPALGESVVARLLASTLGAPEHAPPDLDPNGLWIAFVLLALAEVWRYGMTLQREAEATV